MVISYRLQLPSILKTYTALQRLLILQTTRSRGIPRILSKRKNSQAFSQKYRAVHFFRPPMAMRHTHASDIHIHTRRTIAPSAYTQEIPVSRAISINRFEVTHKSEPRERDRQGGGGGGGGRKVCERSEGSIDRRRRQLADRYYVEFEIFQSHVHWEISPIGIAVATAAHLYVYTHTHLYTSTCIRVLYTAIYTCRVYTGTAVLSVDICTRRRVYAVKSRF